MNLQTVSCPNEACLDKHKVGQGNIVAHSPQRKRCKCTTCGRTFSYRRGTPFYGLKTDEQVVTWVVGLIAWGCPLQAIVQVFGLCEATVADWLRRSGSHAQVLHEQQMRRLDLEQVQVDEIKLKLQGAWMWVARALAVSSRLWLGAVCQVQRDKHLAEQINTCVYLWARQLPLVIAFDGWRAYPKACARVFREPVYGGRVEGRAKSPGRS